MPNEGVRISVGYEEPIYIGHIFQFYIFIIVFPDSALLIENFMLRLPLLGTHLKVPVFPNQVSWVNFWVIYDSFCSDLHIYKYITINNVAQIRFYYNFRPTDETSRTKVSQWLSVMLVERDCLLVVSDHYVERADDWAYPNHYQKCLLIDTYRRM